MGIATALTNAKLGLSASARLADTISNNVSNAMTPGFGRRSTEINSLSLGGLGSGARIGATTRTEAPYLTTERRALDASLGATATRSDSYARLLEAFGEPGSPGALSTLATRLETILMSATASPQSQAKLTDAVMAAKSVAEAIASIADETVQLRTEADAEIGRQVGRVNVALEAVQDINRKIASLALQGVDTTGLQDERHRIIDGIASIIPLRTVSRDNGQLSLYAQNGGALLDGRIFPLEFTPATGPVTAEMGVGTGLSGLSQDQGASTGPVPVPVATGRGLFDGGSLAALFEVRDSIVPEFSAEMDVYAGDMVARFRDSVPAAALDGAGQGLFIETSTGPAAGLAGRIGLNPAVDPAAGGAVWRLRDGLSAAVPGAEGFGTYLQALADAMVVPRAPGGLGSQTAANGGATMASEIASFFAGRATRSDEDRSYLTARLSVLDERETNRIGVDTDAELQSLILVEQSYAANARVLSVADDLLKLLMEV